MQHTHRYLFFFLFVVLYLPPYKSYSQKQTEDLAPFTFIKREFNAGIKFSTKPEREALITDESFFSFEQTAGAALIQLVNSNIVFLPARQEQWSFQLELGPFCGKGNLIDSSAIQYIDAKTNPTGIRGRLSAAYTSRFYFDSKNYTLISLNAWGRYDLFRRNADGVRVDSNNVTLPSEDNSAHSTFRYGFEAKAGWGIGRLNIVNHISTAHYLLEKYYHGRIFSDDEIRMVAQEIGRIKHQRILRAGHSTKNEIKEVVDFLNSKLLLELPSITENDWELTEFRTRFQGTRLEFGPFFNYFNREPDFVYGGFVQLENYKYCNLKLNRKLNAGIHYNNYKKQDWITFEATAGWNWYLNLKHEVGFGIRYLPGMVISSLDNMEPVRHAVIPYMEYFSQLNSKYRIDAAFAYRVAQKDQFVMSGPELSVSFYRSSY